MCIVHNYIIINEIPIRMELNESQERKHSRGKRI